MASVRHAGPDPLHLRRSKISWPTLAMRGWTPYTRGGPKPQMPTSTPTPIGLASCPERSVQAAKFDYLTAPMEHPDYTSTPMPRSTISTCSAGSGKIRSSRWYHMPRGVPSVSPPGVCDQMSFFAQRRFLGSVSSNYSQTNMQPAKPLHLIHGWRGLLHRHCSWIWLVVCVFLSWRSKLF